WSLAVALVMIALGAATVYFAHNKAEEARQELQIARGKLGEIRTKLTRTRDEEAEIKDKIASFDRLVEAGIIGGEQRLQWVEAIKAIRTARGLYALQYEISPQRPLESALAPGPVSGYDFLSSRMRLRMDLLHEEDLFSFLDDLRGTVRAYVRPESCSMERLAAAPAEGHRMGAQLKTECAVDLITINVRKPGT
ncbi:MAG: hypothetical protein WBP72_11825, partial [Rhodocyclaceae bacterium]